MKKMFILCGLVGSGKSTVARKILAKNPNTILIIKDSIRQMIFGDQYDFVDTMEPIVKNIAIAAVRESAKFFFDIVIDETNITKEKRKVWIDLAMELKYKPQIIWCKGNGKNLENRMNDNPRGKTREKWAEVISMMQGVFEAPDGNSECEVIVVEEIK